MKICYGILNFSNFKEKLDLCFFTKFANFGIDILETQLGSLINLTNVTQGCHRSGGGKELEAIGTPAFLRSH